MLMFDMEIFYKCNDYYSFECDGVVCFDDFDIGVDWGSDIFGVIFSVKDVNVQSFVDFNFLFEWIVL